MSITKGAYKATTHLINDIYGLRINKVGTAEIRFDILQVSAKHE